MRKIISIAITHPHLLLEWDYEKNVDIKPEDVSHGCNTKVWWICKNKHLWFSRIIQRSKGSNCPQCIGTNLKLTIEFIKEFLKKYNQTLLTTNYVSRKEKLHIKCNDCNLEYHKKYQHFKYGKVCPRCEGFIKYTNTDVKKLLEDSGDELLSDFVNMRTKIKYKCGKCNTINEKIFQSYLNDHKCSVCSGCEITTYNKVVEIVKNNNDILLTKENNYINGNSCITIKCGKCDYIYKTKYLPYKSHKCAKCAGNLKKTHNEIEKHVLDNGDILISKNVEGTKMKIDIKCSICNNIYNIRISSYLQGHRCNICNMSKGERNIIDYLKKNNIKYIHNKKFADCKNINCLPFDFYVNEKFIIEFDGKQHFETNEYFGGEEEYKIRRNNDIIKTKYCIDKNILLLRISYDYVNRIDYVLDLYISEIIKPSLLVTNTNFYSYLFDKL